ncbi:MAG: NusG domain II-containing protein [Fibrobacterota bacterium]
MNRPVSRMITVSDIVLIGIILATSWYVWISMRTSSGELPPAGRFAVYRRDSLIASFPAAADTVFLIQGVTGALTVQGRDGTVQVTESSCRRKICTGMPALDIHSAGQIVCVPNQIVIRPRRKELIDAVSR